MSCLLFTCLRIEINTIDTFMVIDKGVPVVAVDQCFINVRGELLSPASLISDKLITSSLDKFLKKTQATESVLQCKRLLLVLAS